MTVKTLLFYYIIICVFFPNCAYCFIANQKVFLEFFLCAQPGAQQRMHPAGDETEDDRGREHTNEQICNLRLITREVP